MRIATKLSRVTATVLLGTVTGAKAQVVEKITFTLDGARTVMAAAVGEARKLGAPGGAIAIVDDGGQTVHILTRLN